MQQPFLRPLPFNHLPHLCRVDEEVPPGLVAARGPVPLEAEDVVVGPGVCGEGRNRVFHCLYPCVPFYLFVYYFTDYVFDGKEQAHEQVGNAPVVHGPDPLRAAEGRICRHAAVRDEKEAPDDADPAAVAFYLRPEGGVRETPVGEAGEAEDDRRRKEEACAEDGEHCGADGERIELEEEEAVTEKAGEPERKEEACGQEGLPVFPAAFSQRQEEGSRQHDDAQRQDAHRQPEDDEQGKNEEGVQDRKEREEKPGPVFHTFWT